MGSLMREMRETDGFTRDGPGWGLGWSKWHENKRRDRQAVEFAFFEDHEEVARARIFPKSRLDAPYVGLPAEPYVEIDLVVVRDDKICTGIGSWAISSLVHLYQGHEMIAFSAAPAEGFWVEIGWTRAVRRHRDDFAAALFHLPIQAKNLH
ncbi:hypothetical protein ACFVVC_08465 [Pseudarthrobacter sp. NPDC058196]|uniref:hypothetical protein n=1 Tax=Pseudarthrobacter sp. NPDC058196 TaxID=3346376 RepID=UPI0036D99FEE